MNKKNNLKKNSKMNKKKQGASTGNEIADKLFNQFEKHKEVFFTIRLVSVATEQSLKGIDIKDPDGLLSSGLMDGRDVFLTRAREEHWEFSSLRRAKYSTLCMAHALHESDSSKDMNYTCNKCSSSQAKWHCTVCEDYDLCGTCKQTEKHEHPMEAIKSLVDDSKDQSGNSRYESIQRCIQSLVHACQCRDANCRRMSCHKMKRVVQHTKMCKKRQNASCPVCKQLIALCCYHAKHCNRDGCQVPFCMNIRQKLNEQKRSMARRADMMMRRRMEGLHSGITGAVPQQSAITHPPCPAPSSTSSQSNPSQTASVSNSVSMGGPGSVGAMNTPPASAGSVSGQHMKGGPPMPQHMHQQQPQQQQQQQQQQQRFPQQGSMMPSQPQSQPPSNSSQQPPQQPSGQHGMGGGQQPMGYANQMGGMPQMGQPSGMGMNQGMMRPGQPGQSVQGIPPQGRGQSGPGHMNPPPSYGRGQMQPSQYGMPMGQAGPGMMGGPPQGMGQPIGGPQMGMQMQPGMMRQMPGQPPQQMGGPGPSQPGQANVSVNDPQLQKIMQRVRAARTQEEKETLFNDLKKTPHLFSAFLKMRQGNEGVPGGQQWVGGMSSGPGPTQMAPSQMGQPMSGQMSQQQFYGQPQGAGSQPRGPGGQFAPMNAQQQQWQQQQQFQQRSQGGSPSVQQQFVNQVRSPANQMGMGSSPMMQPGGPPPQGMMGQPDQQGQFR